MVLVQERPGHVERDPAAAREAPQLRLERPGSAACSRARSPPRRGSGCLSGTTRSWSISIRLPNPWQVGQAPNGLLNEKSRGSGSSNARRAAPALEALGEAQERPVAPPARRRSRSPRRSTPRGSRRAATVPRDRRRRGPRARCSDSPGGGPSSVLEPRGPIAGQEPPEALLPKPLHEVGEAEFLPAPAGSPRRTTDPAREAQQPLRGRVRRVLLHLRLRSRRRWSAPLARTGPAGSRGSPSTVATVDRGLRDGAFCRMAIVGQSPSTESTSGFSIRSRNCRA